MTVLTYSFHIARLETKTINIGTFSEKSLQMQVIIFYRI